MLLARYSTWNRAKPIRVKRQGMHARVEAALDVHLPVADHDGLAERKAMLSAQKRQRVWRGFGRESVSLGDKMGKKAGKAVRV